MYAQILKTIPENQCGEIKRTVVMYWLAKGILLRLPGLNKFQLVAPRVRLGFVNGTDGPGAMVAAYQLGLAWPIDDLLECPNHALKWKAENLYETQCPSVDIIDDIEQL